LWGLRRETPRKVGVTAIGKAPRRQDAKVQERAWAGQAILWEKCQKEVQDWWSGARPSHCFSIIALFLESRLESRFPVFFTTLLHPVTPLEKEV
jgi:hypothetical protein